jgi:predicted dithiol-disulfide oxidoreductase (DUF899 family)
MLLDNNKNVSPNEWQTAREKLLAKEKELILGRRCLRSGAAT